MVLAAGLDVRRPRPRVAHPVGVGVRGHRAAEVGEVEERGLGRRVGAVLVAGDHHATHLVVQRVLADLVALVVRAVQALDHHLGHAAADAEPDRRSDHDYVGGLDLVEDLGPLVAVALVGADAEGDAVVDDADDLAHDVHRVEPLDDLPDQGLGVRGRRRPLERAVEEHGAEVRLGSHGGRR